MKSQLANPLDPRIKLVWRISQLIAVVIIVALTGVALLFAHEFIPLSPALIFGIWGVVMVVLLVVLVGIVPAIRYIRFRYELSESYLEITTGIIWHHHFVVPFIRVQNTDTVQGPLMRLFNLAEVTASTASSSHNIPGLKTPLAEEVRDRAAEFARLAREDV